MTYDFNTGRGKRDVFSEAMGALIDAGIDAHGAANDSPRTYLGASQIGDECARRVQYEITQAPGTPFPARIRRIFERGHTGETLMARWLRMAGFELLTEKADGNQFGFMQMQGRYGGHGDGIIISGPMAEGLEGLSYPCLWENKILGSKGYKAAVKDGVVKAHPKYAAQVAQYQAYLDLADNAALVTVVCADTMAVHYEAVPFNAMRAQEGSDRAVRILRATEAGEVLPRISDDPEKYPCAWCSKVGHCFGDATLGPARPGQAPPQAPAPEAEPVRTPPRPPWAAALMGFAMRMRRAA